MRELVEGWDSRFGRDARVVSLCSVLKTCRGAVEHDIFIVRDMLNKQDIYILEGTVECRGLKE